MIENVGNRTGRERLFIDLDDRGYVILKDALNQNQVSQLRSKTAELIASERAAGADLYLNGKSQRVWNLLNKGLIFEEMIQIPEILKYQGYLLGDDFVLSSFTANLIGPGSAAGDWHIDSPLAKFPDPIPTTAFCANTIYVLDDFEAENGATWIVPESHRRGLRPDPKGDYLDAIQLKASIGDIIILHGGTWHASGANYTDKDRLILLGFFTRSFMKPQQDHLQLASPELTDRASPVLRRLLGFNSLPGTKT